MASMTPLPPAGLDYLNQVLGAKDVNEMASAIQSMRQSQFGQHQQLVQDAINQANEDRQQKLLKIKAYVDEAEKNDPSVFNYGAVRAQRDRDIALVNSEHERAIARAKAYLMDKDSADRHIKDSEAQISAKYGEDLKPIQQQEFYKNAKENWGRISNKATIIGTLREQADTLQKMIKEGKMEDATSYAKGVVTKTMNSIVSPDALGMTEMLLKFPSLVNAPEQAILRGQKSPFQLGDIAFKTMEDIRRNKSRIADALAASFVAHPEKFTQDAIQAYNDEAVNLNNSIKSGVIDVTSPRVAHTEIGARLLKPLGNDLKSPSESHQADEPNSLATPNPIQAELSQPAQGGNPASVMRLASPSPNPLNTPLGGSTYFRIKQ